MTHHYQPFGSVLRMSSVPGDAESLKAVESKGLIMRRYRRGNVTLITAVFLQDLDGDDVDSDGHEHERDEL